MAAKYRLAIIDEAGKEVSFRVFSLGFDGIGHNGTWSSNEEFVVSKKAREMYRDAAHAAGKWPIRKPALKQEPA